MVIVPFTCHPDDLWQCIWRTITLVRKDCTNISRTIAVFKLIHRGWSHIKNKVRSQKSPHWEGEVNTVPSLISHLQSMTAEKWVNQFSWMEWHWVYQTHFRITVVGQLKTESINTKQIPCFCVCGNFLLGFNIFCLTGFVCLFILIFLFLGERKRGENRKETKTERQMERKTQRDREDEFL